MKRKTILPTPEEVELRRATISSFKAKADARRSWVDKVADLLTAAFGTVTFLIINAIFFAAWIIWNKGMLPGIPILDPFPFGFLTMVVSLEAIFLAIIVLISQNREANIADLREEVDLYITTYAESEITKMIYLQTLALKKMGVDLSNDEELQDMLQNLQSERIEDELEKQLRKY